MRFIKKYLKMIFVVAVASVICSLSGVNNCEEVEAASKIYLEKTLITMNIGETKQLSIKYDDSVRIKSVVYRLNEHESEKVETDVFSLSKKGKIKALNEGGNYAYCVVKYYNKGSSKLHTKVLRCIIYVKTNTDKLFTVSGKVKVKKGKIPDGSIVEFYYYKDIYTEDIGRIEDVSSQYCVAKAIVKNGRYTIKEREGTYHIAFFGEDLGTIKVSKNTTCNIKYPYELVTISGKIYNYGNTKLKKLTSSSKEKIRDVYYFGSNYKKRTIQTYVTFANKDNEYNYVATNYNTATGRFSITAQKGAIATLSWRGIEFAKIKMNKSSKGNIWNANIYKVKGKISIDPELYEDGNFYEVPPLKKILEHPGIRLQAPGSDEIANESYDLVSCDANTGAFEMYVRTGTYDVELKYSWRMNTLKSKPLTVTDHNIKNYKMFFTSD